MSVSRRSLSATALLAAALTACSETPVELPTATTLAISADSLRLTAGDLFFSVAANVNDQQGRPLNPQPVVTWTSSNPTVALVSPGGAVTPLTVGTATIVAQFGTATDSLPVVVEAPVLDLQPATAQTLLNGNVRFTATLRTRTGRDLFVTSGTAQPSLWTSDQPALTSLSNATGNTNNVSFGGAGTTRIIFRSGALADTSVVQVVNSSADLISAVNIVPDSMVGLFNLMQSNDPARLFTWSATTAAGLNRCQSLQNSGPVAVIPRNAGVVNVGSFNSASCQWRMDPGSAGSTWVVLQVGTFSDSVFVRVVPPLAAVNIVPDSIVVDQTWTTPDQQPLVEYQILDPRGQNVCTTGSIQSQLSVSSRNGALSGAPTNLGTGTPPQCRLRIRNGTSASLTGRTVVLLGQTNGPTDSLVVRVTSNAPQFSADVPPSQALSTLGVLTAGDTVRAGVPRLVTMRVRDRNGAPLPGVVVNFTLSSAGVSEADLGTVSPVRVLTDADGLASTTWTPPVRLVPDAPATGTTQSVTLTVNGLAPNGTPVATPLGVVSSATAVVRPGAPARLVVFRNNPGLAADTLARLTVDSNFVGQVDNTIRVRGYDAVGNRVPLGTARTLVTLTRAERMGATVLTNPADSSLTITTQAFANDSGAVTITAGAAAATLQMRARPTPQAVYNSGTTYRIGSLFNDVATPSTLVSSTGGANFFLPSFTASMDTVSLLEQVTGDIGFRVYIRPVNGSVPAAPTAAEAITWAQSTTYANGLLGTFVALPAFAPSTADYGTVYFVSDSVTTGVGVVYQRTRADSRTACVGNLNPYFVPNGLAVSPDGTRLAVTTAGRADPGTGTDSTQFSQVQLYALPGCTLVATITSNTSGNIIYRYPSFIGSTLTVERRDGVANTTALGDMDQTTGAFTPRVSVSGGIAAFFATRSPAGVIGWRVSTFVPGLFTALDANAPLAPGTSTLSTTLFTLGRR